MTILAVFVAMVVTSPILTLFVLLCLVLMLQAVKKIGGNSARFFIAQQKTLGNLNGYIEEMISGQKVVKVFCHEEATKDEFDHRNVALQESATKANIFANILMPIMMNLGNLQYVLVAVLGRRPGHFEPRDPHHPGRQSCSLPSSRRTSPAPCPRFPSSSTPSSWRSPVLSESSPSWMSRWRRITAM